MTPTTIPEVLTAAADLLEREGAWCQGWVAKTERGNRTAAISPDAVCWCMVGAIIRAVGADNALAADTVRHVARTVGDIFRFNDKSRRTQTEVDSALRNAAAMAVQS